MQITVIIAMLMALTAAEIVNEPPTAEGQFWFGYLEGIDVLLLLLGTLILMGTLMRLVSKHLIGRLERASLPGRVDLRLPGRIEFVMRIVILVMFAGLLTAGGWAKLVIAEWRLGRLVLADEICLMLPLVVMLLLMWHCFYPVNRFIREYIVVGQLAEGLAARPVWSRRQYLSFQARGNLLIVLVPVLLILGFRDVVELVKHRWWAQAPHADGLGEVVTGGGALLVFVLAPLLLMRIWLTRTLPPGPLRGRLEAFCAKMGLRYRDILLWDTYGAVANAAVMGLWAPIRYVLLSDALIENMEDEQIEAVFGHEAAHVRKHHILFLMLLVAGSGLLVVLLSDLISLGLNGLPGGSNEPVPYAQQLFYGWLVMLAAGWGFLFGWVSRRFERQADVHAALAVEGLGSASAVNDLETAPDNEQASEDFSPAPPGKLGPKGARIMTAALMRIALLNGISVEARSWRHSSIRSRAAFLRELAEKAYALRRFERVVILIKIMILAALVVGAGGLLLLRMGGWVNG